MAAGMGISKPMFFVGVVEDNNDKSGNGRVRVRAFGIHGTHEEILPHELPWASRVVDDVNTLPPPLNSFVFGLFLDGSDAQHPIILGILPGQYVEEHDPIDKKWGVHPPENIELLGKGGAPKDFGLNPMSKLAMAEYLDETYLTRQYANAVEGQHIPDSKLTWDEPPPAYAAKYPYNRVIETGRHSIEIDDTPGAERIQITHSSGAYIQIDAIGTVTERAESDRYEINIGTKHESSGHSVVTINGNSHVYVKGNKTEEIMGNYKRIVHGENEISVGGNSYYNVGANANIRGANLKLEGNADRVTIFGRNEVQFEAEKQLTLVSQNIKNTALLSYDVYANKAIKLTTPMDIHLVASNIINTASGLIPPTPLSGGVGVPGFSVNAISTQFTSVTGSFSGIWNAGVLNGGVVTSPTGNFTALNATVLSAGTGTFGIANASVLNAAAYNGPVGSTAVPVVPPTIAIPTLPALVPAAISTPIAVPLPGFTSGWAYPEGNGPLFAASILTSPFAVLGIDFNPLPDGGLGIPRIQMPEPASHGQTIVPKGYFALGYAAGYCADQDESDRGTL